MDTLSDSSIEDVSLAERTIIGYFHRFTDPSWMDAVRTYQGPLDNLFFSMKPSFEEADELLRKLPSFDLPRFLFSNDLLEGNSNPQDIAAVDYLQSCFDLFLPRSTGLYWDYVRRREGFTKISKEMRGYLPQFLLDIESAVFDRDFSSLDDLTTQRIQELIDYDQRLNRMVVGMGLPVHFTQLQKEREKKSGLKRYTFDTPAGSTTSYWDLNAEEPPLLEYDKSLLIRRN